MKRKLTSIVSFPQKLLALLSESNFIKFLNILNEPNIFRIVGRAHYERWHSCFWGWLLDNNGSHLMRDYILGRFLLLLFDERTLKCDNFEQNKLLSILHTIEFEEIQVSPNEFLSNEVSIKNVGRFDIFLTADYFHSSLGRGRINIIFELKIDSPSNSKQSKKYADWLNENHQNDINLLIYILPKLYYDSNTTVGDDRWYCMDYQLLNDRILLPALENPNLNEKVKPFLIQYIKNLKVRHNGIKMAITNEEKKLAVELYEKYSDVFDSIYDALQEADVIDFSTSDLTKGRKSGRLAIKVDGQVFDGKMLREILRNVLKYIVDKKYVERIPLPWGIGDKRFILTNENPAKHPNGKDFFYPETYDNYTIETHYARERGLDVLASLCKKLEIEFEKIDI